MIHNYIIATQIGRSAYHSPLEYRSDVVGTRGGALVGRPWQDRISRMALDGKSFNYVELDVHVGSIAVRRFIESRQPLLTLHGHIHESVRITGTWKERIGKTFAFSAAHDGPELALIRFDLNDLDNATRELA